MDIFRNKEMHRRARTEREFSSRVDQRVLRWFGHVKIKDEHRLSRNCVDGESKYSGRK